MLPNAKLKESGLTPRDAKLLGIKSLTARQTAALQSHYREVPSLYIPYYNTAGKAMDFHRVRYLAPLSGFSEGRKYDGPSGHPPRAYFPRTARWGPVVSDPQVPVLITEGEFKAASAVKFGLLAIGLGGVWNWRSKRLGIEFLPELEAFTWQGRNVELCFDSDIVVKPQVRQALNLLGRELAQRGAKLYLVLLPQEGDKKVGLDDFLVARGRAAYTSLERTPLHPNEAKLQEFLARYAYLLEETSVYDLESNAIFKTRQQFKDATEHETVMNAQGASVVLATEWYKSPRRLILPGFTFDPTSVQRLIPKVGVNRFEGFAMEPRRGSVEPMLKVIDAILGNRPAVRKWLLQWLAYPLQNPGAKLSSCVFVFSAQQGVGKTAIGEVMLDIYGRQRHGFNLSEEDFFGTWNDWMERGLFALCDELSFDGSKKSRSVFKRQITSESAILSAKWRARKNIRNRCNFYFTSNSPGGLPLETGDNRRVLVVGAKESVGADYLQTTFDHWRNREQGASRWLYYLLHNVDVSDFHPHREAPTTTEETLAVQSSGSSLEFWLQEESQRDPLSLSDVWTARQILTLYQMQTQDNRTGVAAVSRALAQLPDACQLRPTRLDGHRLEMSVWAIRNGKRWVRAPIQALRQEWAKGSPS